MKKGGKKKSYKGTVGSTRPKQGDPRKKLNLTPFEILVLFLLLVFIVALPLAYFFNKAIMNYVSLVNFFILGSTAAVKPDLVISIMRKNNVRFEETYGEKINSLRTAIRVFGIFFVGFGVVSVVLMLT